jgi:hypothetical protein
MVQDLAGAMRENRAQPGGVLHVTAPVLHTRG